VIDTRLITAKQDAKAAAAALNDGDRACAKACLDDARTALCELIDEGPHMKAGDRFDLGRDYRSLCRALQSLHDNPGSHIGVIDICDRVTGSLSRLADRWTT